MNGAIRKIKEPKVLFWAILLLAFALRFYGISFDSRHAIPPGLWFDEALNGLDAYKVHHELNILLTYPDIFPREGLFLWMLGLMTYLLGDNIFAMRLTSCLISTGAVAAVFFFVRAAFGVRAALAAMLTLALLRWHVHFGHLIFRTNLVPLFSSLALLYVIKTRREQDNTKTFMLCGFFIAAGFYTYLAWFFFVPVIIAAMFLKMRGIGNDIFSRESEEGEQESKFLPPVFSSKKKIVIAAAAFIIFVSPMLIHYLLEPSSVLARPAEVSPLKLGILGAIKEMLKNFRDVVFMFIFRGDHVAKHNTPFRPVFGVYGFIFFWLGIIALINFRRKNSFSIIMLLWIFCSSMPSVFSKTDSANMLRNLGASVPSAIIYSFGISFFLSLIKKSAVLKKPALLTAAFIIAIIPFFFDLYDFFFKWRNDPRVKMEFLLHIVDAADESIELSNEYPVAVASEIADNLAFKYRTLNKPNIYSLNCEEPDLDKIRGQVLKDSKEPPRKIVVIVRIGSDAQKIFLEKYKESIKPAGFLELPFGERWCAIYIAVMMN